MYFLSYVVLIVPLFPPIFINCTKYQTKIMSSSIIDLFSENLNEIEKPIPLEVQGNIPVYVDGIMLQNGPGAFGTKPQHQESRRSYSHIFDGLSKISKYDINKDGITFQTRFSSISLKNVCRKTNNPHVIHYTILIYFLHQLHRTNVVEE